MNGWARLGLMICAATALGCGPSPEISPDASASCTEALSHSDFAWIQERILTPSCSGFSSCHQELATQAAGLNLELGQAHGNLVNQPSDEQPAWQLVVPGEPTQSYLLVAIGQAQGPVPSRGTMPLNNPLLCQEKRDAVARWVAAGAPND